MKNLTFNELIENHNIPSDQKAFGFVGSDYLTYGDVQSEIKKIKTFLIESKIKKGDRIVLLSENQPRWGIVYLAVTSYGAIIVPILPDFSASQIHNIVEHCEPSMIFISDKQMIKLENTESVIPFYSVDSLQLEKGSVNLSLEDLQDQIKIDEDDTAAILYTSGTTGSSKGVMLSHRNILSNVQACFDIIPISTDDHFLSLLPLAHTYECTVGLLFAYSKGATTSYINGAPTPRVLMDSLAEIKPTMILSVPLLIEKIYRSKISAKFNSNKVLSLVYSIKPLRILLNKIAGKKLLLAFGGNLRFFGIGGAPLASDVEKFLRDCRFPYSIGYGLTETSPLLAGDHPSKQIFCSTGNPVTNGQLRIGLENQVFGVGEIQAKGPNIMKGYYKIMI